jgi:hypothetical protein
MLVNMFGGCHGFEREIISLAAKTVLSIFLLSVKIDLFLCEFSQAELRELIYARHCRARERMASVQGICKVYARTITGGIAAKAQINRQPPPHPTQALKPPQLQPSAYTGSAGATPRVSGGRGCSGVFLVKDIKCRQADVEDFLLTENDFVTL